MYFTIYIFKYSIQLRTENFVRAALESSYSLDSNRQATMVSSVCALVHSFVSLICKWKGTRSRGLPVERECYETRLYFEEIKVQKMEFRRYAQRSETRKIN